jgi:hypothetical protein
MIKQGDLVMLTDEKWVVPGALTALKFYKRLQVELEGKPMLVLDVIESGTPNRPTKTITVFVDGYKKKLNQSLLKVVNEER